VPTAFVSPKIIDHKWQALEGPLLTVEFSAPRKDIIGVKAYHFKGETVKGPFFSLNKSPENFEVTQDSQSVTLKNGRMSVVIARRPYSASFFYDGKLLTSSGPRQLAYVQTPEGPFMRERLDLSVGELYYGLGERFGPFVKNGQTVDIWNEDGGTASEIAYKNMPFFLSNRGYGVLVNDAGLVSFEVASEAVSKNQFSVPGECLEYYVFGGGSMRSALANYTSLTGKPALPPYWSFGLWLSTSFTTDYDEETVRSMLDGMKTRGIPLSVFHFDCFWMKEFEWCNFSWDETQFSDARAMLARIKEVGSLKACVWINPYIGQKSPLFDEALENGYLIKKKNGSAWQDDKWQPGMGIVDFTNPQAEEWYKGKLSALLDMGVDCFKTDFGERIPKDAVYFDGSDPMKMHNYFTFLYNRAVYNLLVEKRGKDEAVVFARSATVGCQSFPVHWGGDSFATYASMAETLRGGLSLACCGFGFWSHDISGFEATATPDLYKRWLAFGMLSTHSRLHGSGSYRVPWLFDDESEDVLRAFAKLKIKLMPYIYAQSVLSCEEGIGVMRPMVMMFPDDPICGTLDLQYMLGDSLLCAPVFSDDMTCSYYLPEGIFTNAITGEKRAGGRYFKDTVSYFEMPLYVKENTLLATKDDGSDFYDITAYELAEASALIYLERAEKACKVTGKRDGETLLLSFEYFADPIKLRIVSGKDQAYVPLGAESLVLGVGQNG
jgi:alpha-D-xyloside xylohydrolase